jgi:hypothetical protein
MEWIILLAIIGGGYFLYQKSPQKQSKQKAEAGTALMTQSEEAYAYLSTHLDGKLKKDLPSWVKNAKENLARYKKSFPNVKAPDLLSYQPEKQAARKKDIEKDIAELNRVKDKFLRVMLRHEHSKDMDMRLGTIYDWNQWIVRKADAAAWHGWAEGLYRNDAELTAWNIKYEEIERRFDEKLQK